MVRSLDIESRTKVIAPPPHITQAQLPALDRQIDQMLLAKPETVALDLGGVQTLDSAALTWILAVQNRLAAQGIQLVIQNPSQLCLDIFLATRLDHRLKVIAGPTASATSPASEAHDA